MNSRSSQGVSILQRNPEPPGNAHSIPSLGLHLTQGFISRNPDPVELYTLSASCHGRSRGFGSCCPCHRFPRESSQLHRNQGSASSCPFCTLFSSIGAAFAVQLSH